MMNLKKYFILILTFGMFMSCSDELSDLNVDPNKSPSANPEEVLSSAQGYLGYVIDGQYNVRSALWAQYWTWGPGVAIGNIERYVSDGTDYDNGWARMYSGALTDLTFVENSNAKVHAGIAKILKAYSFQLLVDHFGSVPFSEALSGATTGNFAPKYDDGQTVYNALIPMIDEGLVLLASDDEVGAEDFVYNGSVAQWTKFANSLKLKILMRQVNVKDVSADVKALIADGNFIESLSDMAEVPFAGISGSENPMYASFERSLGLFYVASSSAMTPLVESSDPRLASFYNKAAASGNYVSIAQGSIDNEPFTNSKANYSVAGSVAYAAANGVVLMTPWEIWFLRAEAAARFGTADDAGTAFENAVAANFDFLGLADGAAFAGALNFDGLGTLKDKLTAIGTQKWISMNGTQEDESWIESRRFNTQDNPMFHDPATGIFKKPTLSVLGAGVHPSIWLFPQSEMSLNQSAPAQRSLTDKVFWDN